MKSISTLGLIALLLFACKLCSLTGSKGPDYPGPSPSTRPLTYAGDLIRQQLGPFQLVKHQTREEMVKDTTGFRLTLINKSNDAGLGEYRAGNGKSATLLVFSFASKDTTDSVLAELEEDLKTSRHWRSLTTTPTQHGKKLEGVRSDNGSPRGMVIWNNGYWLFTTFSDDISLARSLSDSVGY